VQIATKEVHDYNKVVPSDYIKLGIDDICRFNLGGNTIDMEAEAYKSAQYEHPPHKASPFIGMSEQKNNNRHYAKYSDDANKSFHVSLFI
jgi:hypothetical protein